MSLANANKNIEKLGFSYIVGRNVKWYRHSGNSLARFFFNIYVKLSI